jgi:esterase/lipase superfamily enzyme
VDRELKRDTGFGVGHGEKLAGYLYKQRRKASIEAFEERLDKFESDTRQDPKYFGSSRAFRELQQEMAAGCDVLIFIHGFNVSWWQAVTSAMALQLTLNRAREATLQRPVQVVLFTWPSDGRAIPLWSYFSDRGDATGSGDAVGRGFLKLRDYLIEARREARRLDEPRCLAGIPLLCHSMGNFVLQHALIRAREFSPGGKLPRIFDQVFLCAPDVDDDVFEAGKPMSYLPETAEFVTIYHNRGDLAMPVSDYTKGNSDRLGWRGASRPGDLDGRVHQVDCGQIVTGLVEHSYYLCGRVNDDIASSIARLPPDSVDRKREPVRNGWPNIWRML